MYPKAYLFHNDPCDGIEDLFSSPVVLTFTTNQINQNRKAHGDISCLLELYQASGHLIYPRFVTTIYTFDQVEMLAAVLKFGLQNYCYLKSDKHFAIAKSLVKIYKKLGNTMQNISGLESSLRSCYKNLEFLKLESASPLGLSEIDDLAHVLTFRKASQNKLTHLIQKEFIDNFCGTDI